MNLSRTVRTLPIRASTQHPILVDLQTQLRIMREAALISEDEFDAVLRGFRAWLWRHLGLASLAYLA